MFMPSHGNLHLILFLRISNDLTAMDQHIVLEKGIQNIPKELLIFAKSPCFFQIRCHLLTDALQKSSLETPKSSQDMSCMLRMIPNYVCLVMRLLKFPNRPTISSVNATIRIPDHHQFYTLFVDGQKAVHHEDGPGLDGMSKDDLWES